MKSLRNFDLYRLSNEMINCLKGIKIPFDRRSIPPNFQVNKFYKAFIEEFCRNKVSLSSVNCRIRFSRWFAIVIPSSVESMYLNDRNLRRSFSCMLNATFRSRCIYVFCISRNNACMS